MVGPVRKEKAKTAKIYERKVRFQEDDLLFTSTPIKSAIPTVIPGAETHRFRKRKSINEWRRQTGKASPPSLNEEMDMFFGSVSAPYPKTPIKKTRKMRRRTLPTDMAFDLPSGGGMSSSPTGKVIGMPDITDFGEAPEVFSRRGPFYPRYDPYLSPEASISALPSVEQKVCACTRLQEENEKLRHKHDTLNLKYKKLLHFMSDVKKQLASSGIHIDDEMMFDADDEYELSQPSVGHSISMEAFVSGPSTPDMGMSSHSTPSTSYLLSPVVAEPGTPDACSVLPIRRIDEDYDEGYDGHAARTEQNHFDAPMEETVDRLADATLKKLRITEVSNTSDVAFPEISLPSFPRFEF
ncbi:hypothetical protein ACEPAH_7417 [Sanghuangporus vaninii]